MQQKAGSRTHRLASPAKRKDRDVLRWVRPAYSRLHCLTPKWTQPDIYGRRRQRPQPAPHWRPLEGAGK